MMIDSHPYLTRLNTFISPDEMNKDPFFFESRDLTDVLNVHTAVHPHDVRKHGVPGSATRPMRLELPDGRMAWLRAGSKATTCQGVSPTWRGSPACRPPRSPGSARRPARAFASSTTPPRSPPGSRRTTTSSPTSRAMFPIPSGTGGTTGVGGTVGVGSWGGSGGTGGSGVGGVGVGGGGSGVAGLGGGGSGGRVASGQERAVSAHRERPASATRGRRVPDRPPVASTSVRPAAAAVARPAASTRARASRRSRSRASSVCRSRGGAGGAAAERYAPPATWPDGTTATG